MKYQIAVRSISWPKVLVLAMLTLTMNMNARAATHDLVKGEFPPAMDWVTVDGKSLSWDSLRGDGPLVMVFWATWCTVCKKDWPKLQKLVSKFEHSQNNPRWASVSLGEDPAKVARVASKRNLPGWTLADPDETNGKALGIEYVPTICILDSNGRVAYFGSPKTNEVDRLLTILTTTHTEASP